MASNKRSLNAYIRYDGNGRAIAGSVIWRKKIPKVGDWKKLPDAYAYKCCNPTTTTTTTLIIVQ